MSWEDVSRPSEGGRRRTPYLTWNDIQGDWHIFKGRVRERWGVLTNDDVEQIAGYYEELAGKIQTAYDVSREEAEKQIREWMMGRSDTHEIGDNDGNPISPV
ncbi:MAG: CsbD family protein [Nitrococcus sp.]|nr:CsbD family protein [Nitrococcus sp.]